MGGRGGQRVSRPPVMLILPGLAVATRPNAGSRAGQGLENEGLLRFGLFIGRFRVAFAGVIGCCS